MYRFTTRRQEIPFYLRDINIQNFVYLWNILYRIQTIQHISEKYYTFPCLFNNITTVATLYVNGVVESCQGLREYAFRRSGLKSASSQHPGNGLLRDDPRVINGPNVSKIIFWKK
jgi:hypothetical protein